MTDNQNSTMATESVMANRSSLVFASDYMNNSISTNRILSIHDNTPEPYNQPREIITADDGGDVYVTIFFNAVGCLLILCNNSLMLIILARTPRLHTLHNAFMASLGVADLLMGIVLAIRNFKLMPQTGTAFTKYDSICLLYVCMFFIIGIKSILGVLFVTLDRFIFIVHPLKYYQIITQKRIEILILISWFFSVALGGFPVFFHTFEQNTDCDPVFVYPRVFFVFFIIFFLSSATSIGGMYIGIFVIVYRQRRVLHMELVRSHFVRHGGLGKIVSSPLRWEFITFFLVCIIFFVCWFPFVLTFAFYLIGFASKKMYRATMTMAALNSAINFFIFLAMKKDFRSAYLRFVFGNECVLHSSRQIYNSASLIDFQSRNRGSGVELSTLETSEDVTNISFDLPIETY